MKVIGQIYETTDYSQFKKLPDNRDVLTGRVNKLIASISEKYILNPIAVNEHMEIVDGQGRFEARKALQLPIHYYIAAGATSDDCRRMNKYNSKWSTLDFAKSYASAGKQDYARMLKAVKDTGLSISIVLRLANHAANQKGNSLTPYERGELVFTTEDAETVARVSKMTEEIAEALAFEGRLNDAFRYAVKVIIETEKYDHERMLRNCKTCRATFSQMSRLGDQLVEFERIYNKNARANSKIYFSDYMRNRGANVRSYATQPSEYNQEDVSTLKR